MPNYEIMFIVNPNTAEEDVDKIKSHRDKRAAKRGRTRAEGGDRRSAPSQAEQMPEE